MNIAIIKKINEKMPYWMKRPFAGIIRRRLITNPVFLKQYQALIMADSMPKQEKEKLQMDLLQQVLQHAYDHTTYYRRVFDDLNLKPEDIHGVSDLQKLPVLTKTLLSENYTSIQADDIDNYYEVSTGGTTGKQTYVLMEKNAIYCEWAFIYHYWSYFGYDYRSSKLATFRGVDLGNKLSEINPLYQEIRMNPILLNRSNIKEYIKRIEKFGANFIYGYPSAIYNFCRLLQEANIAFKKKFKAILLISENLYPFQEAEMQRTLDCPIAIFYGHSERAVFGEKIDGGYLFNSLYGVTEISADGEPIVTGFINRKTPLIRYLADDSVHMREGKIQIYGHKDFEVFYGVDGQQFRSNLLDFHGMISKRLSSFQFVQEAPGMLILKVVKANNTPEEIETIRAECERRLGKGNKVYVEMVDSLMPMEGKYKKYSILIQKYHPNQSL